MDVSGDCDSAHPPSHLQHLAHPAHCPSLVPHCQADCALCLTCTSSVTVHLQPYRGPTPILQMRNDAPRGKATCSGSASCSGETLKFKLRFFGVPESQPVTPGHYCLQIICGIKVSINLSNKHKKKRTHGRCLMWSPHCAPSFDPTPGSPYSQDHCSALAARGPNRKSTKVLFFLFSLHHPVHLRSAPMSQTCPPLPVQRLSLDAC